MKIEQDSDSGAILVKLGQNESCNQDPEELLTILLEFVSEQAKRMHNLNKRVIELETYIHSQAEKL